jgi:cytochrome c oxidase subunit 2
MDSREIQIVPTIWFDSTAMAEAMSEVNIRRRRGRWHLRTSLAVCMIAALAGILFAVMPCMAAAPNPHPGTNIFHPDSTPADAIYHLSHLVLSVTALIFAVVAFLLVYVIAKYRDRGIGDNREPAQVYGSTQIELAWTVLPVLIVVILFLATARVIHGIQDAVRPPAAMEVTAIGHQFWWEFRYPVLGIVTANELHVPVSDPASPTPTFLKLLSADTDHSFWIPELAGKTDLIPNRINEMWIDPHQTGTFLGQCAQYCGTQHAKMLLRVYVDSPEEFQQWVNLQKRAANIDQSVSEGRRVFETTACVNCHAIAGTAAIGTFGPDLTHLMSRQTIASGAAENTEAQLKLWIENPDAIKPGSLMPAMKLSSRDSDALVAYLRTLR